MNFNTPMNECQSPVDQDFIWLAEYNDGTYLTEFDLETKEENNFNDIDNQKIVRFGLIGKGMKFYYEKESGIFKLAGQMIEVTLKTTNYEFYLTGQMANSSIVQYKTAEMLVDPVSGDLTNKIIEYNFGYQTNLNINGFNIDFKVMCSIPYRKPISLNFEALTNQDTNGFVRIRKNGIIVDQKYKTITANQIENYIWELK